MERIIHFEQFYYTNYGQGMRFEGNSTETARTASALELLAANWMKQELNEPVEMVLYNSHLGCYVSAMTVPCTQTGDARTSYWIHAVMPDEKESDGFMDCLSWPLQDYVTEVHLAQHLSPVTVRTETCDLSAICRKYHLTGERLTQFLYQVLQNVCDSSAPSCLCFVMGEEEEDYNAAAREIMAVVYHLLPKPYRKKADYLAKAGKDMDNVRFYFRPSSYQSWQFDMDTAHPWIRSELPEEETVFLNRMTELFRQNPAEYEQMMEQLCRQETDDYDAIVWNYYTYCLREGEMLPFSQETLLRIQPFLEERLKQDEGCRQLLCQCMHQIDTKDKTRTFVQTLMEKYISAAAGLPQSGSSGYKQSLERNWQLMDQLSAGKTKIVASYLKWMKDISIPYYQDFVEYGSKEGRDWLMDMQFADEAPPGCQELLKMDVRQMNAQRGHQWVNAMAQCIQTDINLQNSSAAAKAIWNYLIRLVEFMVPDSDAGGDAGQMLETTIQMQQLLQFIWKHRSIFDVTERVEICGVAKAYGGSVFDVFSRDFWREVRTEDFETLYEKKGITKLFANCPYDAYHDYRRYVGRRHKEEKTGKTHSQTLPVKSGNISDKLSEKESSPSEIDTQNLPGMMNQWVPDALADYGLWGLAMGTGFLAGLVFAWFAGYGVVTLIVVILVILLTAAAGIVYFKCKK